MKKVISAVAAIIALIAAFSPCVCADWYDEIHSGKYTVINKNGFISDTFCGVNAYYNLTDTSANTYYQCNELVIRFYKEAYGLNVFASFVGGPPLSLSVFPSCTQCSLSSLFPDSSPFLFLKFLGNLLSRILRLPRACQPHAGAEPHVC